MNDTETRPNRARFDELAVLVEVAEAGSIAAAARRLGVPKSTLGRAIARLEETLGTALVRRMASGPALTEAGRDVVALSAPHVAALRDVTSAVARAEGEIHGTIRITAPVDLAQIVLAPLVTAFVARYPRVQVEVDVSMRMVDMSAEGFDLALRVAQGTLASSSLVAKKLARLDLGLYASPTYLARRGTPRRPEDLEGHDHVLLFGRRGRATLALEGPRKKRTRLTVVGRTSANDFFFIQAALVAGAGVGPLPGFLASADVASGRLARVVPECGLAGTTAYVVHVPLKPLPAKVEAFKRLLVEHAPRILAAP